MCFLSFLFLLLVKSMQEFTLLLSIPPFFLCVTTYGQLPAFFFCQNPPLWQLLFSPFVCVCVFRNCFQKRGLGQSHRTVSRRKITLLSLSEDNHFIWTFQKKKALLNLFFCHKGDLGRPQRQSRLPTQKDTYTHSRLTVVEKKYTWRAITHLFF